MLIFSSLILQVLSLLWIVHKLWCRHLMNKCAKSNHGDPAREWEWERKIIKELQRLQLSQRCPAEKRDKQPRTNMWLYDKVQEWRSREHPASVHNSTFRPTKPRTFWINRLWGLPRITSAYFIGRSQIIGNNQTKQQHGYFPNFFDTESFSHHYHNDLCW